METDLKLPPSLPSSCAECRAPGEPFLACENGKLYHPICYFAMMQAYRTPVQLPLFTSFDGLWPKGKGSRKKVKRVEPALPFMCHRCLFPIYEDMPIRCAEEALADTYSASADTYYHAHCYRDACLAAGLPDPMPPQPVARKRRAQPPVHCAVCGADVMRSMFVTHVRTHERTG